MNNSVTLQLTEDEAKLFLKFQEHYLLIAPMIGFIEVMNLKDLGGCEVTLDFATSGRIGHAQITKHYRDLSTHSIVAPVVKIVV